MRQKSTPYVFLSPFVILYLLVLIGPLVYAFYTSLFTSRLVGGVVFAGFTNYLRVFESPDFWSGVKRMVVFGVIQVSVMLGLAMLFALLFDLGVAVLGRVYRLVYFLPYAVPGVIGAILWGFMLEPQFGALTGLIQDLGLGSPNLLASSAILPVIGLIVTWQGTGFNTVIIFTALRSIPHEVTEAAVLDGARLGTVMFRVKLPLVGGAVTLSAFLGLIGTLQLFAVPYILLSYTSAITSYYTPNMYIYNLAFSGQEYNFAAATSFLLAFMTIAGVILVTMVRRAMNRSRE